MRIGDNSDIAFLGKDDIIVMDPEIDKGENCMVGVGEAKDIRGIGTE